MGSACRPNPKWEAAANKLEIKRAPLRPPAQGVPTQIQRQPLQLLLLAEARGQGPGLVIACQRKGGFFCRSVRSEKVAGAGAEVAAVAAEVEDELSKFRELWQGPAERLEEFPELLAVSVGAHARWGPGPGASRSRARGGRRDRAGASALPQTL